MNRATERICKAIRDLDASQNLYVDRESMMSVDVFTQARDLQHLVNELTALKAENAILREGLEHYADKDAWYDDCINSNFDKVIVSGNSHGWEVATETIQRADAVREGK